jgi:hypothetical protein
MKAMRLIGQAYREACHSQDTHDSHPLSTNPTIDRTLPHRAGADGLKGSTY